MTGWRVGYAAARREIIAAMTKIHQYTIMCAPTMAQVAAIEALKTGEPDVLEMVAGLQPPAQGDRPGAVRHRPELLRAEGRLLRLPFHRRHRHELGGVFREAAPRREGGGRARLGLRGSAARAMSAAATPPPSTRSKKPWAAWGGSSAGIGSSQVLPLRGVPMTIGTTWQSLPPY